jgi:hypothetical protein
LKQALLAGIGALAFGVLTLAAMAVANPPGGNYKVSDIASYLAKDHRPAIFLSVYMMLLSVGGLLLLLARLRDAIEGERRASIFWGFSVAATGVLFAGYLLAISPALALAFSGGHLTTLSAPLVYTINEAGYAILFGAGALLLGCALCTFVVGPVRVPGWVRWFTALAAIASLAALAWFPFFLIYLWAIVIGVRILVVETRGSAAANVPQPA